MVKKFAKNTELGDNQIDEEEMAKPEYPRYCEESERLISFIGWPRPYIKPEKLAAAGFFYLGLGDDVTCFECGVEINDWKIGEDPLTEHTLDAEDCRFINGLPCGNVPINSKRQEETLGKFIRTDSAKSSHAELKRQRTKAVQAGPSSTNSETRGISFSKAYDHAKETMGKSRASQTSAPLTKKTVLRRTPNSLSLLIPSSTKKPDTEKILGAVKGVGAGNKCMSSTPLEKEKAMVARTRKPSNGANPDTTTGNNMTTLPAKRTVTKTSPPGPPPSSDETGIKQTEPRGETEGKDEPINVRTSTLPTTQGCRVVYFPAPEHDGMMDFSSYDARIKTFEDWPQSMAQTPASLADAGLYYLGVGDKVKCFSCKGHLHKWAIKDDPWEQHAYWYKKCKYVLARKGSEFIRKVSLKPPMDASLAETMACYRSYCQKGIKPIRAERIPLPEYEKAALMECIPTGFVAPGTRLDDVVFENLCRYCGMRRVGGIYVPCTHTVACYQCAIAANKCDICNEEILFVKNIIIIPDRPYHEYEHLVTPMMIQEANDLTRATIRTLQALAKK